MRNTTFIVATIAAVAYADCSLKKQCEVIPSSYPSGYFRSQEYQYQQAVAKQTELWHALNEFVVDKPAPIAYEEVATMATFDFGLTANSIGDEMPVHRPKFVHAQGLVARFEYEDLGGHPFTGIFNGGSTNGILRFSDTFFVIPGVNTGLNPSIAFKFLLDGKPSVNLVANVKGNTQVGFNPLKQDQQTKLDGDHWVFQKKTADECNRLKTAVSNVQPIQGVLSQIASEDFDFGLPPQGDNPLQLNDSVQSFEDFDFGLAQQDSNPLQVNDSLQNSTSGIVTPDGTVPPQQDYCQETIGRRFIPTTRLGKQTGFAMAGTHNPDGSVVQGDVVLPFHMFFRAPEPLRNMFSDEMEFKPTGEPVQWWEQLQEIAPNQVFFEVWAYATPCDYDPIKIGNIWLKDSMRPSEWGDRRLFFQHVIKEDDFKYMPEQEQYLPKDERLSWAESGEVEKDFSYIVPECRDDAQKFLENIWTNFGKCPFAWFTGNY